MAERVLDKIPMLSNKNNESRKHTPRSASLPVPVYSSSECEGAFVGHAGPLHGARSFGAGNDNLLISGPLGLCNIPSRSCSPAAYKVEKNTYKSSHHLDTKLQNISYGDSEGWGKKSSTFINSYFPIMDPHAKIILQWNTLFVSSCLVAIFIDPLFFFLFSVDKDYKCIVLDWSFATEVAALRSLTDFIYFLHMVLQFRLAYVAPESTVVGAGDLVVQPDKIAKHYFYGHFPLDLFVVLPLPQVMIFTILPHAMGAGFANTLLRAMIGILIQYIPRIFRFLPLLAGQSQSSFIFESAWASFVVNLLLLVLAAHVVGSCWYLFGLQRVIQCLLDRYAESNILGYASFIDRRTGMDFNTMNKLFWTDRVQNLNSSNCFIPQGDYEYGIYKRAVSLSTEDSTVKRYIYSLFWGFQQISTLARNLVPSYSEWEVLFTMAIVGSGLLLFALLIGNILLQGLGRRRLENQLRRRDIEQWMDHRQLPEKLKSSVIFLQEIEVIADV